MTTSTSITESHSIHAIKISVSPDECADAAERLIPAALSIWEFESWMVRGFLYRYGTPDFDGEAPEGVNVISSGGSDEFWTDRVGVEIMAPLIHADWTDIVGCVNVETSFMCTKNLAGKSFVLLSCIDGSHWICVSSDADRLKKYGERIPYISEVIHLNMDSLSSWGL